MLTRNQMHRMLDELPETDLKVISRILESLQATLPEAALQPQAPSQPAAQMPLARQYSQVLRSEENVDSGSLLRKVMFTPLSELLTWVNQSSEPKA